MQSNHWKPILYLLLAVVSTQLMSCRPTLQYPEALLLADSLTQCNADSAVRLLQELAPTLSQAKEPVRRYHQLLTIKAQDKAFIPHTSDSLVLTLLRYYQEEGDPRLLPEACYYAGRVTRDLGDAPQALDYFHQALDALQTSDYQSRMQGQEERTLKLQGKIHAQMGYLFRRQHLYDEAIKAFEKAYRVDSVNRDTTGMIMDIKDLGNIYLNNRKYNKSLAYFQISETLANNIKDSISLFKIACQEAALYNEIGEYKLAKEYLEKYKAIITRSNQNSFYFIKANILSNNKDDENAASYYSTLLKSDELSAQINANLWFGKKLCEKKDLKAFEYFNTFMQLEDSARRYRNEEAVVLSQSLYNYQLREKEIAELKLQETKQRARTWIFTILAATAAGILYYIERARRRKIRSQYEHLRRLIAVSQQHAELKKELSSATIADLRESETYKKVCRKCKNNEALTKNDWKEIESLFNTVMPEFLHNLHGIYSFNETEWKLSLLTKMDFTWQEIATLVSLSYPAVHSSQSRLHKKVFKGDVTYQGWKDFINSL